VLSLLTGSGRVQGDGNVYRIYIPVDISADSQFPFKLGDVFNIQLLEKRGVSLVKAIVKKRKRDPLCTLQGVNSRKLWVYIPTAIAKKDFPLKSGESIDISIVPREKRISIKPIS